MVTSSVTMVTSSVTMVTSSVTIVTMQWWCEDYVVSIILWIRIEN